MPRCQTRTASVAAAAASRDGHAAAARCARVDGGRHGSTSRSAWSTVTASSAGGRLRQAPVPVGAGLGGQRGLLLAGGGDPPAEPLGRQVGVGRIEAPGARPDEDLGARPAELLDGGRDGVRAEQAPRRRGAGGR